jgi:predicted Fe-Mo cluster-binding NifX family protein
MRIAVSAENNDGLQSRVSSHFGRCPYFMLVEVQDGQIQNVSAVDNPLTGALVYPRAASRCDACWWHGSPRNRHV